MTTDRLGITRWAWQCDCYESHFITLTKIDEELFLEVHITHQSRYLWDRIKDAWHALLDPKYDCGSVIVTEAVARELIAALQTIAPPLPTAKIVGSSAFQVTEAKHVTVC